MANKRYSEMPSEVKKERKVKNDLRLPGKAGKFKGNFKPVIDPNEGVKPLGHEPGSE